MQFIFLVLWNEHHRREFPEVNAFIISNLCQLSWNKSIEHLSEYAAINICIEKKIECVWTYECIRQNDRARERITLDCRISRSSFLANALIHYCTYSYFLVNSIYILCIRIHTSMPWSIMWSEKCIISAPFRSFRLVLPCFCSTEFHSFTTLSLDENICWRVPFITRILQIYKLHTVTSKTYRDHKSNPEWNYTHYWMFENVLCRVYTLHR